MVKKRDSPDRWWRHQALDGGSSQQVLLKNVGHIGGGHTLVEHAFWVDQHVRAAFARAQAARVGDGDLVVGLALLQLPSKGLQHGRRPLGSTTATRMTRRALLAAHEHMAGGMGHGKTPGNGQAAQVAMSFSSSAMCSASSSANSVARARNSASLVLVAMAA